MSDLKTISALADRQLKLEGEVSKLEDELKKKKEALTAIAENDLPEAMEAAGVSEFVLSDGSKVTTKTNYYANISDERSKDALRWLIQKGFGAIIRRDVSVQLGKGENKTAKEIFRFIKKAAPDAKPEDKAWVHHATLRAFVKERMEAGEMDDKAMKLFGVHSVVRATIKPAP